MQKAVLWDLDGTLVDSQDYHWQAWLETLEPEGVSLTRDRFLSTFGRRNVNFLGDWLGPSATLERIVAIGDAKEARYRELLARGGIHPLPGADAWLERLHAAGWRQAIASSAPRANVEVMLGALAFAGRLEAIVSSEDVQKGKPEPDVFLAAAAQLGVPPHRCIVVEDAPAGIEAARRAGMRSIYVRPGPPPEGAGLAAPSLEHLPADAFELLLQA